MAKKTGPLRNGPAEKPERLSRKGMAAPAFALAKSSGGRVTETAETRELFRRGKGWFLQILKGSWENTPERKDFYLFVEKR